MTDSPSTGKSSGDDRPLFDAPRQERGLRRLEEWGGASGRLVLDALSGISPDLAHYVVAWGFGEILARPVLDARDRELITLAFLTALGGCETELKLHVGAAVDAGVSPAEITETLIQSAAYCGMPRALSATLAAGEVLGERGLLPVASVLGEAPPPDGG